MKNHLINIYMGRISIFRFMHNFPVGETPTGSRFYRQVSPPACEKLKYVLYMVLLQGIGLHPCPAQVYTNDAGAREKHFIYEVKQIDEFFERFNDDKDSFIRKTYQSYNTPYTIKRADLVRTLFNYETHNWDTAVIDSFIAFVTNKKNPSLLNFYGSGWYAEALCRFQYQGSEIEVPVILRIDAGKDNRSKWMVTGIRSNEFPATQIQQPPITADSTRFIQPASHGNNFIALGRAFEDREHLSYYFDKTLLAGRNAGGFYNALLLGQLKFLYVKRVTYHFLQIRDWIFTVQSFPRAALNSGWLINSLAKVTDEEKQQYIKSLLGR